MRASLTLIVKIRLVSLFRCSEAAILTMKTLTGTRLWSKISYRKPPRTCTITRIFPASNEEWTGQWRSTNDREGRWYRNYYAALNVVFVRSILRVASYEDPLLDCGVVHCTGPQSKLYPQCHRNTVTFNNSTFFSPHQLPSADVIYGQFI
jgi:hypothetical protein